MTSRHPAPVASRPGRRPSPGPRDPWCVVRWISRALPPAPTRSPGRGPAGSGARPDGQDWPTGPVSRVNWPLHGHFATDDDEIRIRCGGARASVRSRRFATLIATSAAPNTSRTPAIQGRTSLVEKPLSRATITAAPMDAAPAAPRRGSAEHPRCNHHDRRGELLDGHRGRKGHDRNHPRENHRHRGTRHGCAKKRIYDIECRLRARDIRRIERQLPPSMGGVERDESGCVGRFRVDAEHRQLPVRHRVGGRPMFIPRYAILVERDRRQLICSNECGISAERRGRSSRGLVDSNT